MGDSKDCNFIRRDGMVFGPEEDKLLNNNEGSKDLFIFLRL